MLDNLSGRFNRVLRFLKGEAQITEDNMKQALREIRLSLLEADVNFRVVKQFVANIRERALGSEVQELPVCNNLGYSSCIFCQCLAT